MSMSNRKKRSVAWSYFDQIDSPKKEAKCQLCGNIVMYSGNATNLTQHLQRHHPEKYKTLIDDVDNTPFKQAKISSFTSGENTRKYPSSSVRATTITKKIAYMIAKDLQPFSIVEDEGFKALINFLEPGYEIPTRREIRKVAEEMYNDSKNITCELLHTAEDVNITTDMWTDTLNTRSYMAITAHFITQTSLNEIKLHSLTLQTKHFEERHTSDNIKSALTDCFQEFQITEKVRSITTDNGANVVAAVNNSPWQHYPCYTHTLNLVVNDSIKESVLLEIILAKCREVVHIFKSSTVASSMLEKACEEEGTIFKTLKKDVSTRWNSIYIMLQSILHLKKVLMKILPSLNLPGRKKDIPVLVYKDFELIENVAEILKPFFSVTEELSAAKYVSCSKIIPITKCLSTLLLKINSTSNEAQQLKIRLIRNLTDRMGNYSTNTRLKISTFLDPRFKGLMLSDLVNLREKIKNEIKSSAQDNIPLEEALSVLDADSDQNANINICDTKDVWRIFDEKVEQQKQKNYVLNDLNMEIRKYEDMDIISRNEDPLKWWSDHGNNFPNLWKLISKYLSRTATSVPSERVFSKSGQIITARRARLKPDIVDKMTFLNMNL